MEVVSTGHGTQENTFSPTLDPCLMLKGQTLGNCLRNVYITHHWEKYCQTGMRNRPQYWFSGNLIDFYLNWWVFVRWWWDHSLCTFIFIIILFRLSSSHCCMLVKVQAITQTALSFTLLNQLSEQQRAHNLWLFWWLNSQKWTGWMWN